MSMACFPFTNVGFKVRLTCVAIGACLQCRWVLFVLPLGVIRNASMRCLRCDWGSNDIHLTIFQSEISGSMMLSTFVLPNSTCVFYGIKCLHMVIVVSSSFKVELLLVPLLPIGIVEEVNNVRLQFYNIAVYDIPYDITVYLEILMYKEITHIANASPWHFRMCSFELVGEHACGFTYNLDVLYYAIIAQHILFQLIFRQTASMSLQAFYCLKYMFQSALVSNCLFHKLEFYLGQQFHAQRVTILYRLRDQHPFGANLVVQGSCHSV